jgi:hypothetical protein
LLKISLVGVGIWPSFSKTLKNINVMKRWTETQKEISDYRKFTAVDRFKSRHLAILATAQLPTIGHLV